MAKKGRKPKYELLLTPENLIRIKGWAMDGLSDEQIAKNMGIAKSTLNDWKTKFPDLSEALKKSKEVADREVENALIKRAIGFKYDEITYETNYDEDGEPITREVKRVTKMVVPDTGAAAFWLKNRKPDVWKDKHEVDNKHEFAENFVLKIGKKKEEE